MNLLLNTSTSLIFLFTVSVCTAQIKNAQTESVKIYGNCGMCETTIENAGNLKKSAQVDWNKDTKMATLTYDTSKTNRAEILKRIALAGYDSDQFLAPDDVYTKLPKCCQYDRVNKTATIQSEPKAPHAMEHHPATHEKEQGTSQLKTVFDNYFSIKDALIQSDQKLASSGAEELRSTINAVKMEKLATDEHTVWMKVMRSLKANTDLIATSSSIEKQRQAFMILSSNMYDLMKVSQQTAPVYYQHCPMYNDGKGANWLSKENAIKNPYYGEKMLSCGKTTETIK